MGGILSSNQQYIASKLYSSIESSDVNSIDLILNTTDIDRYLILKVLAEKMRETNNAPEENIKKLIEHINPIINQYIDIGEQQTTLLITAVKTRQNLDIIEYILYNANVNQQDTYGNTALHYAVAMIDKNVVIELIGYGAKNIPNNQGITPYDTAKSISGRYASSGLEIQRYIYDYIIYNPEESEQEELSPRFNLSKDTYNIDTKLFLATSPNEKPSYKACNNNVDYITQDEFNQDSNILYIEYKNSVECFELPDVIDYMTAPGNVMAYWRNNRPNRNKLVFKFPNGWMYIDQYSMNKLTQSDNNYYIARLRHQDQPIGNLEGSFGVSRLHGTPVDIYRLYKIEI